MPDAVVWEDGHPCGTCGYHEINPLLCKTFLGYRLSQKTLKRFSKQ